MGGLAAGAGAAGRYAGKLPPRRALAIYAGLEIAIGVLAILMFLWGISIEIRMRLRGETSPIVLLGQRLAAASAARIKEGWPA
jgi:hypothetical protein